MVDTPTGRLRRYRCTPDRVLLGLLAVEGVLLLSERFRWLPFNQHKGWTVLVAAAAVGAALLLMCLWLAAALLLRWRFQFSIRSLFVLVVVVAALCSWLAVQRQQAKRQQEAVEAIGELGGLVLYDWQLAEPDEQPLYVMPPHWLHDSLGADSFVDVAGVGLGRTQVTDAELEHLKGLTQLRELELNDTRVTDAGLEHLKGLTQLHRLNVRNTQVTDAGLEHLKGLTQLQSLSVANTLVTDAGLEHLKGLRQLHRLWLNNTRVTEEGVQKLRQALPNCEIVR